jgi:hypothetical protein
MSGHTSPNPSNIILSRMTRRMMTMKRIRWSIDGRVEGDEKMVE